MQRPRCPDCGSAEFAVNGEGCDVCSACGLVQGGAALVPSRPPRGADGDGGGGGGGGVPGGRRRPAAKRPRGNRHVPSRERWTKKLRELASLAGLSPALTATAASVYGRAAEMPDWKNRKHDYQMGVLVACMFHACNIHRCHRTPAELCAVLGVDPRNARRMVKVTERAADQVSGAVRTTVTFVPTEVLPRCAFRLGSLPLAKIKEVRRLARDYYDAVRPDIDNHRPDTITAGLLSAVLEKAGVDVPDSEIAEACLVATNTVRAVSNRISALVGAAGGAGAGARAAGGR